MLLAQASEISNYPQTLIGLLALAGALIIADWIKNRGKTQREENKVSELSQQTSFMRQQTSILTDMAQVMHDIRDGQEYEFKKNKKARKRLKVVAKQVGELHAKHIKPSQNI